MPLRSLFDRLQRAQMARCHWARIVSHVSRRARALPGNASGNVTIEFGFIILFLVTLAIGAFDFGRLGYLKIAVTSAARAGAQYGAQDMVTAGDDAGMRQAARDDIGDSAAALAITARDYYFCPADGEVTASDLCSDGTFSFRYVEVTVPDQLDLLFPYPGIDSPRQVASTSIMRVR